MIWTTQQSKLQARKHLIAGHAVWVPVDKKGDMNFGYTKGWIVEVQTGDRASLKIRKEVLAAISSNKSKSWSSNANKAELVNETYRLTSVDNSLTEDEVEGDCEVGFNKIFPRLEVVNSKGVNEHVN